MTETTRAAKAQPPGLGGRRHAKRSLERTLLLLMGALVLPACGEATSAPFRVDIRFSPTPPLVGDARVILAVQEPSGDPVDGASVTLSADPVDGDGGSEADASWQGDGSYVADALRFDRPGEWIVTATVRTQDGRNGSQSRRIRVSGPR